MPAQVTTRSQVNGYRFLIRRLEHALIRGDSRMIHDPMRGQMRALLVGVVAAVVITGAAGILAFIRPTPNFGGSTIMISNSNGTMFVRIGDRLHPALNLASARLISGKSDPPKQVDDKFLNSVALGPSVGIVGAPTRINGGDDMTTSSWTVCDTTQLPSITEQVGTAVAETTVLANDPVLGNDVRQASPDQMILTTDGDTTFLIYNGVRAAIDPHDPILSQALRLRNSEIREVSPGLLNAFPLVDPIVPIVISGAGEPTNYLPSSYRVGSILKIVDSRGDQLLVVLREGLQPISPATADIIRYGNPLSPSSSDPISVAPALASTAPAVHALQVDHYPATSPRFVRSDPDRVVCMAWQRDNSAAEATTHLLVGNRLPVPNGAQPVRLATADGSGPRLDSVYLRPGTGEYVQDTGAEPTSRAMGQLYYVSDMGVRYHINDVATAMALGVVGVQQTGSTAPLPQRAPWPVLSLLPAGPGLSQQAALIAHDGLAADTAGVNIAPPKS
ncbi:type VII secretion protein EccB [Mycobacterium sp. AZCC_0083]|uniref:type VII secretion protein EccB n=1 Tax=Mycobacterium sp. AZCC_0083 TaxID=2735882 RepID=UPI001614890B|nr:type VII secretion protein EccB [Mycobacterium sp. AZCC_0083]MBB5167565.1 type VII secretion protein EccB [Mycobacterium sp. AZCC_0083]